MIKRGIIQLGGLDPKIRISKPGVDVDEAGELDFLLHEQHLYSQPYHFSFVACPFAGNTSYTVQDSTVSVTIPDVTSEPVVLVYPVASDDSVVFPFPKSTGTGASTVGFLVESWFIYHEVVSSTRIDVRFYKPQTTLKSPEGAYIILMRGDT